MINRSLAAASWLVLAYVAFATLSPIALRPELTNANVERFGAFMLIGFLFASAYPKRFYLVVGTTVGSAILLEALQFLTPGRHGRVHDAAVKIAGAIAGIFIGKAVLHLRRRIGFDVKSGVIVLRAKRSSASVPSARPPDMVR